MQSGVLFPAERQALIVATARQQTLGPEHEHRGQQQKRGDRDLWVPKSCVTWADVCGTPSARSRERCLAAGLPGLECDDLPLVGLNLIFLVVTRAVSVLGLSRREAWRKDAENLMPRHQLAVALRERPRAQPRLMWPAGRGWRCSPGRCRPGAWPGCG